MSAIKFGIVGRGNFGGVYEKCAKELKPDIKIQFYDVDYSKSTIDFDEMVLNWATHIAIATPPEFHHEIYAQIRKLQEDAKKPRRVPILVAKPVFLNRKHFVDLTDVFCGMTERYNAAYRYFKKESQSLPIPVTISFNRACRKPSTYDANLLSEVAIHDIDLFFNCFFSLQSTYGKSPKIEICSTVKCEDSLSHFMVFKLPEFGVRLHCEIFSRWIEQSDIPVRSFLAYYPNGSVVNVDMEGCIYSQSGSRGDLILNWEKERRKEVNYMLFDFFTGENLFACEAHEHVVRNMNTESVACYE